MRNKVKRTLSFLLTFVMLCSLLPAMAMAKEGKDDVWNNEYGSIRIYVDDYTWNEMKSLPGIGVNQVKIDADNYPEDDRGCSWMPGENYFYTTNPAVKVKATDINALILTKIAIDTKEIKIPMEGDETHTVTVSEGKFGADTPYLRIDIKERKEFKLIFDAGDGFFADGSQKQVVTLSSEKPEETYPVPQVTTEPENYRFSSWKNEEKGVLGKSELSYSEVKGLFEGKEKGELTYHAVYDELYQVSYTVSGDQPATFTPDIPGVTKYVKGEEVQVAAPLTTTETSYNGVNGQWVFNGWTTTDVEVNEGKFVMPQGDVTLTGSWTFTPNPVEEKKIIVNFNKVGGTWADGVTEDAKTFVLSSTTPTAEMDVPEVVAPAGKKLSHWENNWEKLTTLPENGIFTYNSMAAIVGTEQNELYITWNPVYEDIPVEKTLRIHWAIDDPEGATWADGSNAPKTETIAWADKNNFRTMPELEIKDGYKLAGWSVSGTESQYWGADTTTFSLGDQLIVEDENGGFVSITANVVKDEEPVEKTLKIHWAIDNPEGAAWKLYEGNARTETIAWADRGNTFVMPELEIKDGYKLAGWSVSGTESQYWGADTTTFSLGDQLIVEDENGGFVSITANVVKDEEPVEKTLKIHWAIDNPEGAAWKLYEGNARTETIAWADRGNTFVMPELEIKDGYKLAGWSVSGTEGQYWDPETYEFGLTGLIVEDENGGQVSITANVVKDEEPAGKTLRIHWAIDNPEGAAWKLYEGNARTETIAWADRGNTFVMPELEIKDGYKLAGWSVSGTEGQYWDPETYEFGLTGLIVEDENGGQVSITANVVKDEVSTEDKIANVYFTVNPKYGYFKEYGEGPVSFENIDADSTQQFEVPEVVAKSGYKFVGWEGKGAGEIKWDANASTFGVPGLCYFPEGSNVGRADIRAVFEKEGGGHINDYAVTVIVDGKGEVKTKDYGTVGSNDTDVIWIPDFVDSVKFTMEPADGWKIDDVLVNGKSIGAEDSYVFETEDLMDGPELKVIFEKKSSGGGGGGSHDKDDDKDKDKAPDKTPDALNGEDHFNYIVGDADGKVHPERNITRAEVASIFFRLLKDDVRSENLTDQNTFADVSADDWYNVAVSTMSDMGIVFGRTDYQFDPDAYITRAEFAAIAARFDSESYSGDDLFTDIEGHWAENQINRAAEKGWITGYPDGTFDPNRYITRAEAVTMINRVLNRLPESADALHEDMNVFPDNMDTTAWYYLAIQEATSSHEYEKDKDGVYETWTDVLPDRDWAQYLKLN